MNPYARDLLRLQFFERAQDQAVQRLGIDRQFAPQHAARDGEGKLHQVGFGLGAQPGAQIRRFRRWIAPAGR